jgi:hypothetical protein
VHPICHQLPSSLAPHVVAITKDYEALFVCGSCIKTTANLRAQGGFSFQCFDSLFMASHFPQQPIELNMNMNISSLLMKWFINMKNSKLFEPILTTMVRK